MTLLITKQVPEPVWCIGSNNYIECTLIEFVGKLDWNLLIIYTFQNQTQKNRGQK